MATPTKEEIRTLLYGRLMVLLNSPDEDISLKAAKELGTIAGIYAEVQPKALSAQQTNNFTLTPEAMSGVISNLRLIGNQRQSQEAQEGQEAQETISE